MFEMPIVLLLLAISTIIILHIIPAFKNKIFQSLPHSHPKTSQTQETKNKNRNTLELVYLPKGNTVYIPEWFTGWPLWCHPILDDRKWLSIAFIAISDQYSTFFSDFFTKWLAASILDDRKSPSITFLAISNQYATFILFDFIHKITTDGHFGAPKITFDRISRHFRSICKFLCDFFYKIAAGGHFGWQKITFDRISGHFRSIHNFDFYSQNGCRCNRLRCPLARMSGLQCFNMGHNGHGINLYGVSMTLMGN